MELPATDSKGRNLGWARQTLLAALALLVVLVAGALGTAGCDSDAGVSGDDVTTSSAGGQNPESGDVEGQVGSAITVGSVRLTVKVLQATFQPALPAQKVDEEPPTAPEVGESFYQAYVTVENLEAAPVRIDPWDFVCLVGGTMVSVDPTLSGPVARSLLKNTSLDMVLTFKARAGFEPELLYSPPWYEGTIRVKSEADTTTEST